MVSPLFGQVSKWVGTEIVREERLRERAKVLRCFIDIAWECLEINSFNVVQAGNRHVASRLVTCYLPRTT